MSSLRKRYADRIEASSVKDEPPVTTVPEGTAAKLPEPAADVKPPPEMPETKESPGDIAARQALRDRLREMERADQLSRQAAQPPPQYATEPQQQQQPAMPAHVEKWLAAHPQYTNPDDAVAQAEIYTATLKCNRDGKTWDQPDFIPALERHLGLTGNGHAQNRPIESRPPVTAPAAPPRSEPVRQQTRSAAPVSAPPSREPASMRTGRPQSFRAPLTAEETEIARASGITPERYAQEKEKMLRLRAAGQLDDQR
jgi:hypothetical protein